MTSLEIPQTSTHSTTSATTPAQPSAFPSPSATAVNLDATLDAKVKASEASEAAAHDGCEVKVSQSKKWSLLAVFSLGFFIDIWQYSAAFILTEPITETLDVLFEQQAWVITSYATTFAAFLLFWGRVSDL